MSEKKSKLNRRKFLLQASTTGATLAGSNLLISLLTSCTTKTTKQETSTSTIFPSRNDALTLDDRYKYQVLISQDTVIGKNLLFGYNADYNALLSIPGVTNEYLLWTNHESINRVNMHEFNHRANNQELTKEEIQKERKAVGGSVVHIKRNPNGDWSAILGSKHNKRFTGTMHIPFSGNHKVKKKTYAEGTLGNCAGGFTPWGTILSGEENFETFYGSAHYQKGKVSYEKSKLGWEKFFPNPPEHYGYVVEINPFTGKTQKHVSMGRFAHESATVTIAADGRPVVYTGDDTADQCLYKFVGKNKNDLSVGELFVADLKQNKWISLDYDKNKLLQKYFDSQTDVLVYCREAADIVGGTKLDRPEDIEVHPTTKQVYVALTGNEEAQRLGSIIRLSETNNDPLSESFTWETILTGGPESGVAFPDNMAFDSEGNLWLTNDMPDKQMHRGSYAVFGNNGLFKIPIVNNQLGKPEQIASAPTDAELTGPFFHAESGDLFLSVQHPGVTTSDPANWTSHWPNGGNSKPLSSVVVISKKG